MTTIEQMWKQILKDIYTKGDVHHKDDAEIKEILNVSGWIDNPLHSLPNAIPITISQYIDLIRKGVFDIDGYNTKGNALAEYTQSFDNREHIRLSGDNPFIYTYPERIKAMRTAKNNGYVSVANQFNIMIRRLEDNAGSNRAVATLYTPGLDATKDDIPCLNWIQALIRDDNLYLSVMFRSNDIYNAFPSNMHFISYIGMSFVDKLKKKYTNLDFAGIYYNATSCHYYTNEVTDDTIKYIIGEK